MSQRFELDEKLKTIEEQFNAFKPLLIKMGRDIDHAFSAVKKGFYREALTIVGSIIEDILKNVWKREKISGKPTKKNIEQLFSVIKNRIELESPVDDYIIDIQRTRNRAAHGGEVVLEDCMEALRRLPIVLKWYFEKYSEYKKEKPKYIPYEASLVAKYWFSTGIKKLFSEDEDGPSVKGVEFLKKFVNEILCARVEGVKTLEVFPFDRVYIFTGCTPGTIAGNVVTKPQVNQSIGLVVLEAAIKSRQPEHNNRFLSTMERLEKTKDGSCSQVNLDSNFDVTQKEIAYYSKFKVDANNEAPGWIFSSDQLPSEQGSTFKRMIENPGDFIIDVKKEPENKKNKKMDAVIHFLLPGIKEFSNANYQTLYQYISQYYDADGLCFLADQGVKNDDVKSFKILQDAYLDALFTKEDTYWKNTWKDHIEDIPRIDKYKKWLKEQESNVILISFDPGQNVGNRDIEGNSYLDEKDSFTLVLVTDQAANRGSTDWETAISDLKQMIRMVIQQKLENARLKERVLQEQKKNLNTITPAVTQQVAYSFQNLSTKALRYDHTHHKGILFWVDDNFIEKPLKNDENIWGKLFGDQWHKTYRLMDLELRIETTYKSGKETIEKLAELQKEGNYIFCIIDLWLPRDLQSKNESLSSENGMKLAQLAKEKGLNCVFLTTESNRDVEELDKRGVASIPYYLKNTSDPLAIPALLTENILSNFRSHVSWISIMDIYNKLSKESNVFDKTFENNKSNLSIKYFPFLNVFRDFVERWEYHTPLNRGTIVIFRSSKDLSDAFIQQCLLVSLNTLVQERPGSVSFKYLRTSYPQYWDFIRNERMGITVTAIRIDTTKTKPPEFFELLNEAPDSFNITYFILPNDESSEPYMNLSLTFQHIIYEDLPNSVISDSFLRESIIRSAVNLILKKINISTGKGEKKSLSDIYLMYPEILFKPLTWIILLESDIVTEELFDSFKVVQAIERTSSKIQNEHLNPKTRQKLINGEPFETSELFDFGTELLKKDDLTNVMQGIWVPRALRFWLSNSWKFPYGVDINDIKGYKSLDADYEKFEERWEDFSLDVLIDLVNNYHLGKGSEELDSVYKFLKHEAVHKLLKGNVNLISDEEWSDLMTERWPHLAYPMPTSLGKKLINSGQYRWNETNHFNLTRIFPSTRFQHKYLDDVVYQIGQQLNWLKSQYENLPEEWTFYIRRFVTWISRGQIESKWQDEKQLVYFSLVDFLKNILPISFIACSILNGQLCEEKELGVFYKKLIKAQGFGVLLGEINEIRKQSLFHFIRPTQQRFYSTRKHNYELFNRYFQLTSDYCNRIQRDNLLIELKKGSLLCKVLKKLSKDAEKSLLEILGVDTLTPNNCSRVLDNLTGTARENLFNFIKDRSELKTILSNWGEREPGQIVGQYLRRIMECGKLKSQEADKYLFEDFFDQISELNYNLSKTFQPTESCLDFFRENELCTFFSSSFDLLGISLSSYEQFFLTLQRLNYIDGYHFMNIVTWLRNNFKELVPDTSTDTIEFIFELFCFGIEAIIAQLKFLLEIAGETDLADKIILKHVEAIKIPEGVNIPEKKFLQKFYEVKIRDGDEKYSVYHLGIPGNKARGKKGIIMDGQLDLLEKN